MHQLLPELCSKICELACIDADSSGKTGIALALVSKYINAISKPYRLQSVRVTSARMIFPIAKRLEEMAKEEGGIGRGIVYLRIELREEKWPSCTTGLGFYEPAQGSLAALRKKLPNVLRKFTPSNTSTRREASSKHELEVTDAFFRILALAAPTLQYLNYTLTPKLHRIADKLLYDSMPASLPFLRTLIPNYDDHDWCVPDYDDETLCFFVFQVPSLEVLDLTGYGAHILPGGHYEDIRRLAPGLKELRIPLRAIHGLGEALQSETLPSTLQFISILLDDQVQCERYGHSLENCGKCTRYGISGELIQAARGLAAVDDRVRLEGDRWEHIGV